MILNKVASLHQGCGEEQDRGVSCQPITTASCSTEMGDLGSAPQGLLWTTYSFTLTREMSVSTDSKGYLLRKERGIKQKEKNKKT